MSSYSCSVFLLDQNELVAKVFDGGVVDDEVRLGWGGRQWFKRTELCRLAQRSCMMVHGVAMSVTNFFPSSSCAHRLMKSASLPTRASQVMWRPLDRS